MVSLPRSAQAASAEHSGYFPGGAVEYTRELNLDTEEAANVHYLVLDGVYRDAMVYVNDHFAAQRPAGYSRFVVNLDPFLRLGDSNELRIEARAHRDSRWYSGLGVHRSVHLLTGPRIHIAVDGVRVCTPDIDDAGTLVEVATTIVNESSHTQTTTCHVAIRNPRGEIIATDQVPITLIAGESGVARKRIWIAAPERWSIDSPALYRAEVSIGEGPENDSVSTTFGVRTLQLDSRHGLRINGDTVKLRGACIHHDNGVLGARSIARAEERRIEILKSAGFNAIRSAHNPLSPDLLDACDRLGMVVLDEAFDMWAEAKSAFDYSLAFPEWWERDIESMVAKDFNHPSVVFYSIGNEIPETGRTHGARQGRLLADKVRSLDPSRFTTNGINPLVSVVKELPALAGHGDANRDVNETMAEMGSLMDALVTSDLVTARTEESFGAVDAAGLNYGDSRYVSDGSTFPHRVIIGTETFSTRVQDAWPTILANDHIVGEFTWTGWDYLGEAGIGRVEYTKEGGALAGTSGAFPWQLAWCGDIDITGHRRPSSYFREIVFGLRAQPYIAVLRPRADGLLPSAGPWSWTDSISSWTWSCDPGTIVSVDVYSDAETVELFLNGTSLGSVPAGLAHGFVARFDVPYGVGELRAVASSGGIETGRSILRSAVGEVALAVEAERAEIRATPDDLAYVNIILVDGNGVPWPESDRKVEVVVDGPGELIALGSANPKTIESYLDSSHTTFDGRSQAVVRPTGAGTIVITVSAEGLASRSITVTSHE
ncbi:glycoside hydrolase family 2 TIM barrel-domain containing protein [Herbiconiux ginsengi]|nr:glycoside hydrolase family 2 TIM barrel-domain containing protein [Herbiconiux ginsengi]